MVPAIKVYKMDYSFIIKNYLNPALWAKTWTLFEYKDYVITLRLAKIDTINSKIIFNLHLIDNSDSCPFTATGTEVEYSLKGSNIEFLIKSINGSILRRIQAWEQFYIFEETKAYEEAIEQQDIEKQKLTYLAEELLDAENVTNDEIRNAYINSYVSNNAIAVKNTSRLRDAYKYHLITDLYLVFLESINDKDGYQKVLDSLEENETENVLQEIKEYQKYVETEEYEEEMKNLLETI